MMIGEQDKGIAGEAQFVERIAKIRVRFSSKLADKIMQANAALPNMAGDGSDAVVTVAIAYRDFHDVCGVAPTIGYTAIGRLARACEAILLEPFRAQRGLSREELARLTESIESLRIAALTEMQSTVLDGR